MRDAYPGLPYSSALLGPGSEVLGYDTDMSTDHDWGPRVYLFLDRQDIGYAKRIRQSLQNRAPARLYDYPVDVGRTVITTIPLFIGSYLALDGNEPLELIDWLTFPSQTLLELTGGAVYRDDSSRLSMLRKQFEYYPRDIWLYLLASGWQRIGQEEHLMLRSGYAGDELGSAIITSRLVRDTMNLCFLMERQYAPYPKWFGTAFKRLACSDALMPDLWKAQTAGAWREREQAFNEVYKRLANMHNGLGITDEIPGEALRFYDRHFKVMNGEDVARRIAERIADADLRRLAGKRLIGSIDQITDNTDFRKINARKTLKNLLSGKE